MLTTLLKLGEEIAQGQSEWDSVIEIPKVDKKNKKGGDIRNLVAEINFDVEAQTITPSAWKEYDSSVPAALRNIKVQGGNNKAVYTCVELKKFDQLRKTLFGKDDKNGTPPERGEFAEAIEKDFPRLKETRLYEVLCRLFVFKEQFETLYLDEKKGTATPVRLKELLDLGSGENMVLVYLSVVWKEKGITEKTPLSDLEGFTRFAKGKFMTGSSDPLERLSYASGEIKTDVVPMEVKTRYSLNKMFVQETKNYATGFLAKAYRQNYQLNIEEQKYLELASHHLLNHKSIRIADIPHCIVPVFRHTTQVSVEDALDKDFARAELLFQEKILENEVKEIREELEDVNEQHLYWLNFMAIESDGNFLKTLHIIKDVSSIHFQKVQNTFRKVDRWMRQFPKSIAWDSVMTLSRGKGEKERVALNMRTLYGLVPWRKDKEKRSLVLSLYKSILEQQKIDKALLYHQYCQLILCHYYRRYEAFKNIRKVGEDHFDFAVRNATCQYAAIIKVLQQLNLIQNMENQEESNEEEVYKDESVKNPGDFQQQIEHFLEKMCYNDDQKAMFYLGRILSTVAYIQKEKKKTVLEKVNFNGMELKHIMRLRNSLLEKAKQYNEVGKVIFSDSLFGNHFKENDWNMNPEEAVFFLLNGYSFGVGVKKQEDNSTEKKSKK